ncbi:hypothetical protein EMPG_15166 [Blastomyces silverae]|uniref:Knr4/Smi1-like domain-containing protein n=1 Tax=Blastomyces silverae TaxID=2060906 RepID=A0A0H1BJS4_9EURO|nr:hypothetical protein EMPG_15166 [Blastomyces silverae]
MPSGTETQLSRRKLLQFEDSEFLSFVSSRIQQFAVLGYTDVAINLISRLNAHERYCKVNVQYIQTLWLLWAALGKWPVGEEEKVKQRITKKREKKSTDRKRAREEGGGGGVREGTKEADVTMEDVYDEIRAMEDVYARTWFYKARKRVFKAHSGRAEVEYLGSEDIASGIETLLDSFERVKPSSRDASTGAAAMTASATLVSALDLRWLLKERGYAQRGLISVEELMGIVAKRMEANQQLTYLTQSRRAWEALKDGTLARAMGVNDDKVRGYANELEETITERIRDGRMELDPLSMRQMLEIIDNNTRTNPDSLQDYMDEPPGSLFHDPASPEEIAAAERDLGIKLPADYKEFLAITDGFEQSWGGIISDPPLHPLSEIRWLGDDEDYFLDLEIELINPGFPYGRWPTVGKAIEIGCEDIDNVWLIPPSKVQEVQGRLSEIMESEEYDDALKRRLMGEMQSFAGSMENFMKLEWCLVTWSSGGVASMRSYPSFTAYTREKVEGSSRSVNDELRPEMFFGYQCC